VEARRAWLQARASGVRIELAADETAGRYGCVIDTARGRIDARLPAQLAALEQAVRGEERDG
jgi:flagellar biosynthesis/type III secretory pathway protein FliH